MCRVRLLPVFGALALLTACLTDLPPEIDLDAGVPTEPDAGPQPEPDAGPQPEPDAGPQPEPDAGPQPEPDAGPQPEPDAGPQPEPDAGPPPEPDAGPPPEPDAGPPPEPDAGPPPEPDAGPPPEPDAGPPPEPDAGPAPEPDAGPPPEPDAGPPPGPDAGPEVDAGPPSSLSGALPAVHDDPLVRMPGSQPGDGVTLEGPGRCLNCHGDEATPSRPGHGWRGSMMAQAGRDPLFWAAFTVALQDSAWALGTPNAGDLCLRCHSPGGWLAGRSAPPNGAALAGDDFDGVSCDLCHRMMDPFFATAEAREGMTSPSAYWDETSAVPASAISETFAADEQQLSLLSLFNGDGFLANSNEPTEPGYDDTGGGQYFVTTENERRGPFADATGRHAQRYSRFLKSRGMCGTCHDVSNPALANLAFADAVAGDGVTVLPSEAQPAANFFHIERTYSEMMLSVYGTGDGAPGTGYYDPASFSTSRPGNAIATCQDCHMPDVTGQAAKQNDAVLRPDESAAHPSSGAPSHDLTGGNAWVPWLLASTVPGSANHDPVNESLLAGQASALTLDLAAGEPLSPAALLDAVARARDTLERAASIEDVSYDAGSGALSLRVVNHTGHKLISGFPEGRRMFLNVRAFQGGALVYELNPYDSVVGTLKGLPLAESPSSPALAAHEVHDGDLVYEVRQSSALTGETHTFHVVLATERDKDNRIPPRGFRIADAAERQAEPFADGAPAPGWFSAAEYAGGYDAVSLTLPAGADRVEVRLLYQTTSREYVEFLRDEINGDADTLSSPTPSNRSWAYVIGSDPFFDGLRAWGDTIWQLWLHNKDVPGAAPIEMTGATWTP